ncbi:Leucine rich repeat-containing protein [Butyrivibrio sp. ob235]|uniref:leucine-rich repeat domain-containing protein n=1 Tax=Butyrivibrio sp. ob235 TaxID=1761780 RepID=UPI0008B983BE|nr:leucine-rich repeat domain-containing protein [Butyrivibrio sp. ob235]SEL87061.1 Leucine rich repeat-containing protein [Butyrivibrio sp. ob235]
MKHEIQTRFTINWLYVIALILLVQFAPFSAVKASAYSKTADGFEYKTYPEGYVQICGYEGNEQTVVIPETINGLPVTGIEGSAFQSCRNIRSVTGNSITNISERAFMFCRDLESVSFPKTTIIGEWIFYACTSLKNVNIPMITYLPFNAFKECSALEEVSFPKVTGTGKCVFQDCPMLKSVSLPVATKISCYVFSGCTSLTAVSFPKVTEFGVNVCEDCTALESADFPSAKEVGSDLFLNCVSLKSVNFPNAEYAWGECFKGCGSLEKVSLPKARTIGKNGFSDCTSLTSVSAPKAESIEDEAFSNCTSLKTISLPGATTLWGNTFTGCTSLTSAYFPKVMYLGGKDFLNCTSLSKLVIGGMVSTCGDYAFGFKQNASGKYELIKGLTLYTIIDNRNLAYGFAVRNGINVASVNTTIGRVEVSEKSYTYTGKLIKPEVVVTDKSGKLLDSSEYKVNYQSNKAVGTALVTVTGQGFCSGSASTTFKILPGKTDITLAKSKHKKQLTLKWNKNTAGNSYEIQLSTNKKFKKKKTKKVIISKKNVTKANIKGLKAGKNYYVRIRSFKKISGKEYSGAWSDVKVVNVMR